MMTDPLNRIVVIGNSGGGKTRLSRRLGLIYKLPITHVDSIQFVSGLKIRKISETISVLVKIEDQSQWIIDGFGPLEMIENRFRLADKILLIDFPVWRHYLWIFKRQLSFLWNRRLEMPPDCNENSLSHFLKVWDSVGKMNRLMRPELLRILARPELQKKLIVVRTLSDWERVFHFGLN